MSEKELKCRFCNKTFKTQKGYDNHMCEKKSRYVNFDEKGYSTWLTFMKVSHSKISSNKEKNKMTFITSPMYNFFISLSQWCSDIDVIDEYKFIEYCYSLHLQHNKWLADSNYVNFIHYFINNEHKIVAIKRSEKYLEENNLSLDTISANRLFFLLLSGKISNKFLISKNIDIHTILDSGQITQLGDLI